MGGREEGQVEGVDGKSEGGLNPSLGLFELAMGHRSASHRPKHA